jgi:hypothetical protein
MDMSEDEHDPKETAVCFAGVALVAEALDCPMIKMDLKTQRAPDGGLCTSGVYATTGAPLYELESVPPHERRTLSGANDSIRARVAACLGLAGEIALRIYEGEPDPCGCLEEESETLDRAREEVSELVADPEGYLRSEALRVADFLAEHWKIVDALADALVRSESLQGDRIHRIIQNGLRREQRPRVGARKPRSRPTAGGRTNAERPDRLSLS